MQHGGGSAGPRGTNEVNKDNGSPRSVDPSLYPGFGYLFGMPQRHQRACLGADLARAREVLSALVALLPKTADNPDANNISDVPSGYTYLLQLVAHDLVQTTIPFWAAADLTTISRNMRSMGLRLDTLYGGGPSVSTSAFVPSDHTALPPVGAPHPPAAAIARTADDRIALRIGRAAAPEDACPFRDLPRINISEKTEATLNFDRAFLVCIADTRNADSIILAQLTVLFSIVHNAVAEKLKDLPPQAAFSHARVAVLYMYYAIISKDLLRRVLNDRVYPRITSRHARDPNAGWLWNGEKIPLEFSHGAYRFGHAMIRPSYMLNSSFNAARRLGVCATLLGDKHVKAPNNNDFLSPLPPTWIVEWSRFFDFTSDPVYPTAMAPNYACRLAPRKSAIDACGMFEQEDTAFPDGATLRDALSAATAQMWTVDALVAEIRMRCPDMIPGDWLFGDPDPNRDCEIRHQKIRQWLEALPASDNLKPQQKIVHDNMDVLCRELPLSLFVLLEAAADESAGLSEGGQLGVLGSIIVGDVIGRLLAEGRAELEPFIGSAKIALGPLWAEIEAVTDMPQLVKFAEKNGELSNCADMPFVAKT